MDRVSVSLMKLLWSVRVCLGLGYGLGLQFDPTNSLILTPKANVP